MMQYTAEEERIFELAEKIKEIRETCLFVCGPLPCEHPKKAKKLTQEIEAMGYLVRVEGIIDTNTADVRIDVQIFKPKSNLTPELAKIYDDWLIKRRLEFDQAVHDSKEETPMTDNEFLKKARVKMQ